MPQRRALQGQMPAMPLTSSGTSEQQLMFDDADPSMQMESPDTRRRRLTPAVGFPDQPPTGLQQLLAMMRGNNGG